MQELEMQLLKMWEDAGIKAIYKYKNRINAFREPLFNIELFNDLTYKMFKDVEDTANNADCLYVDYAVSVEELIQNRYTEER